MFLQSPELPIGGAPAGQQLTDSPGSEPTITEIMRNPSKVIQCTYIICDCQTEIMLHWIDFFLSIVYRIKYCELFYCRLFY